ncbi:UNVERIFIED_CONTAM: ATP-dependent RNA helicase dbp7 [Siphonaria sp. JEL0065]|nr:ATP-dependent RNA helicase dbp7 [Siphonaria sp. JEL0065]
MPQLKFNTNSRVLTIVPFGTEKLLAMTGNARVRIHYDHIKAIYVRPTEAYVWANNVARKEKGLTSAVNNIPGRKMPDLHLYSRPRNVVGLDLVNHHKYGRVFFDVPNHPATSVAQRLQQETGLVAAIKDFHPTDKFGSSTATLSSTKNPGNGQIKKPVDNRKIDVLSKPTTPAAPASSSTKNVKFVGNNRSKTINPSSQGSGGGGSKPKGSFVTSLFTGNETVETPITGSHPNVKQSSNAVPTQTTDTTTVKGLDGCLCSDAYSTSEAALVSQGLHKDCMVQAQTGSGKTLAYLLPIIYSLMLAESQIGADERQSLNRNLGTLAIVLAPTRELAKKINAVLEQLLMYSRGSGPKPVKSEDDDDENDEKDEDDDEEQPKPSTRSAPKVSKHWIVPGLVVGGDKNAFEESTPGRLLDHFKTTQSFELGNLRWLVLDDADRLLELGFEQTLRELLAIIDEKRKLAVNLHKRLNAPSCWPTHKQILLTFATIKGNVQRLAETSLKNPLFIKAAEDDETEEEKLKKEEGEFDLAKKASKGKDFIVKKESAADDESDEDFWDDQQKLQDHEAAVDEMQLTPANDDADEDMFTVPEQLKQTYVIIPAKLRLVTLVAVLRQISSGATNNHPFKAILFTDSCDSVDFLHHTLSNGHKGPSRDEAEAAATSKPKPKELQTPKQPKGKQIPKQKKDSTDTDAEKPPAEPEKPSISPAESDTLPSSGLFSPLFPETHIYKLHGNLSQKVRDTAYTGFKQNPFSVLICTDVAARGLDLPDISFVIQYDMPCDVKDYVHRIGRTARLGREGSAVSLLLPSEVKYVELLAKRGVKVVPEDGMALLKHLIGSPVENGAADEKKGKRKDTKKRSLEDWATDVQMMFERFVMADEKNLELARSAFRSHVRAYTTHVASEKHLFNIKALHLGHVAKSFALRDALGMSMGSAAPSANHNNNHKKEKKKHRPT